MNARIHLLHRMILLSLSLSLLFVTNSTAQAYFHDEAQYESTKHSYSWQNLKPLISTGASQTFIHLLKWNDSSVNPPSPEDSYDRARHFGGWISIRDDRSCLDVRNRVLVRDSQETVRLKPDNPCKIQSGVWHDPYTNSFIENPREIDIDHLVPLKNAYINGAWKWNNQQRCLYANYMGYRDHLKSVSKLENIYKSDKDPSRYVPPHQNYRCEYLKKWLTVKLIWKLTLHVDEAQAIRRMVEEERCNTEDFIFSTQELDQQRKKIMSLMPICAFRNPSDSLQGL